MTPGQMRKAMLASGSAALLAREVVRSLITRDALWYALTRKKLSPLISNRSATSSKILATSMFSTVIC